jgi:hypothetical protein
VLNTAYSELQRLDVLDDLDLKAFDRGAYLRAGDFLHLVTDPRQAPAGAAGFASAPLGSAVERAALGAFAAAVGYGPPRLVRPTPDVEFGQFLRRWRIDGDPTEHFLRPFLAGVLLENRLTTSARFTAYVLRTFLRGIAGVPAGGVGALPDLLASRLPAGTITYGARADAIRPHEVDLTGEGTLRAGAVIVAADPVAGAHLLGLPAPRMHAVVTVWHAALEAPVRRPTIALDTQHGPVANSVVMSNAAPSYSPDRRALIASSSLGPERLPDELLRSTLARLWGAETRGWQEIAVTHVPHALPDLPGGSRLRKPVRLTDGLYVAGDWRDTPSSQGALASGRRAANAYLAAHDWLAR